MIIGENIMAVMKYGYNALYIYDAWLASKEGRVGHGHPTFHNQCLIIIIRKKLS